MRNKRQVLISIMVAVVVLAVGVYYQIQESTKVKVQERVQKVCTLNDISRVEFKEEHLVIIEKEADTWRNPELSYLEYDNELISEWLKVLQTIETVKVVKNVEDESTYGINEQSAMITVYDNMNNSQTLRIGATNVDEDILYIKSDQDEVLYMVPYEAGQKLLTKPNTFVKYDGKLKIQPISKLQLNYQNEAPMNIEFSNDWYLNDYFGIPCKLNEEVMTTLIESIMELDFTGYIGTYETLETYGLEEPKLEMIVNDETKLSFGNTSDDSVYVRLNGANDVYTIDKALYTSIETFKPFDAIERQVVYLNLDEINKVTLSNPQGTYELLLDIEQSVDEIEVSENKVNQTTEEIQSTEIKEDNKEIENSKNIENGKEIEADSTDATFALLNKKPLTAEMTQEWLDKIQESLYIEALLQNPKIEQKEERKAEATIEYSLKDGSSIQIELIPYDINYYILRYNGHVEFAVNKDKVTKLFTQLDHFVKAE